MASRPASRKLRYTTTSFTFSIFRGNSITKKCLLERQSSTNLHGQFIIRNDCFQIKPEFSYNEIGQLMFVKDQAGLETDYQYDSLGRMTNVSKPPVFNPEGGTNASPQYGYQYDSYGNILDIRDPKGRETKFTYDAFGQLMSRSLPLLQTNFNAYNALGLKGSVL